MATATKTNERPGTRAQVRYVRMSASKARVVLDLIRGKHVGEASQILAFSERLASEVIMKCLTSAVANASHNEDIPAEELYISACYADEGPTLKRFRPRARGRAGRIHKQTCHITIVVSRYDEDVLDELRSRAEQRSSGNDRDASASRRRRVARSRAADAADDEAEESAAEDATADTPAADTPEAETAEETTDDSGEAAATEVADEAPEAETGEDTADDAEPPATASDEAPEGADGASDEAPQSGADGAGDGAAESEKETD